MPNYLHRTTKRYLLSTSPADLVEPEVNYIMDPDLSAVRGQPNKYWTISGDAVLLKSKADRDQVDIDEAAAAIATDRAHEKNRMDIECSLQALAKIFADEINILRAQHGLQVRTVAQVKAAYKAAIDVV